MIALPAPKPPRRTPVRFEMVDPAVTYDHYVFARHDAADTVRVQVLDGRITMIYDIETGEVFEVGLPSHFRERTFPLGLMFLFAVEALTFLAIGYWMRGHL